VAFLLSRSDASAAPRVPAMSTEEAKHRPR